jgi:hypothetical protein
MRPSSQSGTRSLGPCGLAPCVPVAETAVNVVASRRLLTVLCGMLQARAGLLLMRAYPRPRAI